MEKLHKLIVTIYDSGLLSAIMGGASEYRSSLIPASLSVSMAMAHPVDNSMSPDSLFHKHATLHDAL
jgi:hypothetical protein